MLARTSFGSLRLRKQTKKKNSILVKDWRLSKGTKRLTFMNVLTSRKVFPLSLWFVADSLCLLSSKAKHTPNIPLICCRGFESYDRQKRVIRFQLMSTCAIILLKFKLSISECIFKQSLAKL